MPVNPPVAPGPYVFVTGAHPKKIAVIIPAFAGPPPTIVISNILFTYSAEDGLYHAPWPNQDTMDMGNGNGPGVYQDWPPPIPQTPPNPPVPALGPPVTHNGTVVPA